MLTIFWGFEFQTHCHDVVGIGWPLYTVMWDRNMKRHDAEALVVVNRTQVTTQPHFPDPSLHVWTCMWAHTDSAMVSSGKKEILCFLLSSNDQEGDEGQSDFSVNSRIIMPLINMCSSSVFRMCSYNDPLFLLKSWKHEESLKNKLAISKVVLLNFFRTT